MAGRSKPGRRRRIYQLVNPITMAIEGAAITPDDKLNKLRALELTAIEQFVNGTADEMAWYHVDGMRRVCEAMATAGIGPEALPACDTCEWALNQVRERHERTGRWGVAGTELQAFRDVYRYIDLQRQAIDRRTFETHIRRAMDMVKSGVSTIG